MNTNTHKYGLTTFLRWGIYLSALMPLIIFSDFLSPFHVGKVLVFRSWVELLAVLYVVLILRDRSYLPPRTNLFWAVTAFTGVFGLTTLTSINFTQSFWGTLERMGGWYSFIHFWAYFVMLTGLLKRKEEWLRLIELSLVVSLLSATYGFLQKTSLTWVLGAGGRAKIFGTIGNPALFAGYMISNVFLALLSYVRPGNSAARRYFYLVVFLLDFLAVIMTGVRGSVIALVVGVVLFGLLQWFAQNSKAARHHTLFFAGIIIVIGSALLALKNTDFVKNNSYLARYSDISLDSYTVKTRFWAWQAGFDGFNDSVRAVVLGAGPENFNVPFAKHFNPKFFRGLGSETLFDRAHNQFLEVLFTMGLLGGLAYLSIFVFAFRNLRLTALPQRYDRREIAIWRHGLICGLVAYIIHNAFIFDTSANYLLFFLYLGLINFLYLERRKEIAPIGESVPIKVARSWPVLAGVVMAVLVVYLIYTTAIIPARANYATTRAIVASWDNDNGGAFEKFKIAMTYDTPIAYEIRNRYAQYIIDYVTPRKIDAKLAERLAVVIKEEKKNVKPEVPDYLPYLYISRAYIMLGKADPLSPYNDLALDNARQALAVSPDFVRTYYELAQVYLNKKNYAVAAEQFKHAVELNPDVGLSWWYLGITVFEGGDKVNGAKIIQQALAHGYEYQRSQTDLLRLVTIYLNNNDFQAVAGFYEQLIKLAPKNPQYHASLALAYSKIGKIDLAVAEAKLSAQVDSKYESEARRFVTGLGRQW